MEQVIRQYTLGGHVLQIEADSEAAIGHLEAFVGALRARQQGTPDFRIRVSRGALHAARSADQLVYAGPVLDDGDYTLFKGEDDLLLLADDVSLHIQPSDRVADLTTLDGAEIRAAGTAGMLALEAAIDSFGQASVHAAGLTLPGTDDLVLLYAASGTGKTTTALNLARAGFGLCSDDAMVLAPTEAGMSAWGIPRYLKVHANTARMLPWLAPSLTGQWDSENEQEVPLHTLATLVRIEDARPRAVVGVFMLSRTDRPGGVARLNKAEALAALAADNVRGSRSGVLEHQARRWTQLARLIASSPVFELRIGADQENVPARILAAVSGSID
jgi:hypothetical protein